MKKRKPSKLILMVLFLFAAGALYLWLRNAHIVGHAAPSNTPSDSAGKTNLVRPTPVVATRVRRGDIGVYKTGLGSVTPIFTVTVKSRVDGQLMKVNYQEGDYVRQGDLLAEIDPRPFDVALEQAQGQFARDTALLHNALVDKERYEGLLKLNAIPEQQLATQQSLVEQYQGVVKADQGQVDSAKLNLDYCRITAPISGRVGLRLVDPGNIVHAADAGGLVVITQIDPISVIFTLSEDDLPVVMRKNLEGLALRTEAWDRDFKRKLATGALKTVDNEIDPSTGTVKLRADFDNRESALFPNQFVNVRLLVEEKRSVNLVTSAAVQMASNSNYVYLIKPDSTVTVRQVTQGVVEGDDTEVTAGLIPDDTVVLTGIDKLVEGSKVQAQVSNDSTGRVPDSQPEPSLRRNEKPSRQPFGAHSDVKAGGSKGGAG